MGLRPEVRSETGGGERLDVPAFRYPPSVALARVPTPVEPLERLSEETGIELDVKRDDLTGLALSGNKVRKLEFLLAAAHDARCDTVITCGGIQSNHARATAVAGVKLGLAPHLVLRGEPPAVLEGNLFLSRLCGATVRYITREQWAKRDEIMREEAAKLLASESRRSYVVPEGGSNALGAFGYIRCAEEIALAERERGRPYDYVVCATGSAGTQAGLIAGKILVHRPWRVLGFAVCDSREYFAGRVEQILLDLTTHYGLHLPEAEAAYDCQDGYVGAGYALSRPEELDTIREVAEAEGLFLDPTYTGKAFHGLLREVHAGRIPRGSRVLFVHTGGLFGLFPKAAEFGLEPAQRGFEQ
jgi:D-cysteine desulfhydrase